MHKKVYIFNSSGCHGHYLRYIIDRFSKHTPTINELPFNELGNSHLKLNYSDSCQFVDHVLYEEYKNVVNQNVIHITYDNEILYFERACANRAGDRNRNLYKLHQDISFLKTYNKQFYQNIKNLYKNKENAVPKWLLRDVFKLGFLDLNNHGSVVDGLKDKKWIMDNVKNNNKFAVFNVCGFFNTKVFLQRLKNLDQYFDLAIDFEGIAEVHEEFLSRNKILQTHQRPKDILESVKEQKCIGIDDLDILQEAYVYSQLEKTNDFIMMPLINDFFKDTKEIIDYIDLYPEHYKAMNPNLPKFNGIANPFFLHKKQNQ